MDSLITTFHIDWKLIIAQLVNFAIVFAVLYFFAIKPLQAVMSKRTAVIEKGLADAKESAARMDATKKEYAEMLLKARQESQDIVKTTREEAEKRKAQIISESKDEVAKVVIQGKNQMAQEKLAMVKEAKAEVISLVMGSLKKVLAEGLDKDIDEKLIKKSFSED